MTTWLPVLIIAEYTGIPASRIYRWVSSGRLDVTRGSRPGEPMRVDYERVLDLDDTRKANGGYLPPT